jgi:hypothetical protein
MSRSRSVTMDRPTGALAENEWHLTLSKSNACRKVNASITPAGHIMQQVFIELYNYKPAWKELPQGERAAFIEKIIEAVKGLKSAGVDVITQSLNSVATDRRAPYDFFCVYRVPNAEFQREFERQIAASGWYTYFDQANVSGDVGDFQDVLLGNAKLVLPAGS